MPHDCCPAETSADGSAIILPASAISSLPLSSPARAKVPPVSTPEAAIVAPNGGQKMVVINNPAPIPTFVAAFACLSLSDLEDSLPMLS